ncbi:rod shape-determining protein [Candidatus Kaiserbacteria bacterium RIFCSPLOWO2_12_FULL_52_8]|uniref:Cell shape-determining protein MreB n=1 Tax=Candidatus Kaiserbacteria bacterium RIFCSPHIGHO2_01_FULL_53_31 TaxID=1798481 RepID=A0A1F6CIM9_9BACT|nr:MAG: rod shape-determining protein [Candidatus Kaiserbacteria bacterium RIFCSPHIGHO2_01_FULL_53_31]OGG92640.1 MAG: rod shape-determining protein [Candidatus Kaiserbacteria bacterium RIFCSPLOWO2_12_FULL_52_8]
MSFFSPKLGIDLGTTNILVFVPGKGVVINEPSIVAVSKTGDKKGHNKILAIGAETKQMIGRTPDGVVVYRPMKDGVIADYRVTEAMLRYFMKKALRYNPFKPTVLISVPASVTSTEKRAVIEAALKAGAKNAYVVKEPILAAIGAGIPIHEPMGRMVADIGGGTIDVAVISLGGIVASTSVKCAGNRLDRAIADHIKKHHNLSIGDKTAEDVKIKIGAAVSVNEELTMAVKGRDFVSGLPRTVDLATNDIAQAMGRELREMTQAIRKVLQETPPELAADIIDNGIILTGGTSQLRQMPELVYRRTGVVAKLAQDPYFCVVRGTGIALKHLSTYQKSILAKK